MKLAQKINVFLLFLNFFGFMSAVYAFCPTFHNGRPVFTFGTGMAASSNVGARSQAFPIQNPVTDEFYNYSANNSTQTSALYDGFLGMEWHLRPKWLFQAGLNYHQIAPYRAKGGLLQGVDMTSANSYNYYYNILARQLLIEGKFLYQFKKYHPYLMAGIGSSLNNAYGYRTTIPFGMSFTRMYANHTARSLSYALGGGVDIDISRTLRLGAGYRFADLGQAKLGSATIDSTPVSGTFSQSHLYVNEVLVQLTVI